MASKDEPTQSGRQNLSMEHVRRVKSSSPVMKYIKDVQLRSFYYAVSTFLPSPWNQRRSEMSLQKVATSYTSERIFNILLDFLQSPSCPLVKEYWKKNENEYVIGTTIEYEDHVTKFIQCFLEKYNLTDIIKYVVEIYIPINAKETASPNQLLLHVNGAEPTVSVRTGLFKGRYTCKFALTVAHGINVIDERICMNTENELLGCCRFKSETMQIAHQNYTTDLALIALCPISRHDRDMRTVIEIQGQRYWPKLCSKEQINDIKPGDEVWIVDQFESLKTGKVFRHWYNNADEKLHNIMQVKTTDGKALTIDGDSGCCVCLPPRPNSHNMIEIFGMVRGISEFSDGTGCTNAVLLPIVLKHALRNLPPNLKKVGDFCEDAGLPVNVDFSEDLDFYIGGKSENLTVQSVKSIGPIVMENHDSGVGVSGILRR